ncbi:MAG: ATP-binding protein [Steroidobacteraceae bacterium]|jgi:PAS domain S-box-containing protein
MDVLSAAGSQLGFLSGGVMGAEIRAKDWAATSLGPPQRWTISLKSAIRIMIASRYAMWMAWGPDLTFLCNDAYLPTLGSKQGWLGARSAKVWEEIWSDIGPRIDRVITQGEATWDEGLLLFLERSGFREETYHTFSYSPLADDDGTIAGMLCVVTEETERLLGERRLRVLRDLGLRFADCRTEAEIWNSLQTCLMAEGRDVPFALVYLIDADAEHATLACACGIQAGHAAAPLSLDAKAPWPLSAARMGEAQLLRLDGRTADLPRGPWDKPASDALMMPISAHGQARPIGTFIAGLNPYRPLDADYRGFLNLLVGQIAAALANANAYTAERARAEALAQLDKAKTAFFSNISHEFRTPLTLMIGPLEDALASPESTPALREFVSVAHRNSLRLLRLVNALLDFSRIEAGRMRAAYQPTDLAAFTTDIAESFRAAIEKSGLTFGVQCTPLSEPVYVDRDMWEKIVLNLLSNAFKFTFRGGIELWLLEIEGGTRLDVRDTGTGIAPEELPRLFERFHRVEGAKGRSFEGSGIGLALVQELVNAHGGHIAVKSAAGSGSTFSVQLPFGVSHLPPERVVVHSEHTSPVRADLFVEEALRWLPTDDDPRPQPTIDTELPARAELEAGVDPAAQPAIGTLRSRVLVADDNADLRSYIARLLGENNCEVAAVGDGEAALAALRTSRPDILISDVMMPKLDGIGLLRAIRADPTLRELPVILLSARAGTDAQVEGLNAQADDYLTKPFSARELIARVRSNIAMARLRHEAVEAIRATRDELQRMNETLEQRVADRTSERDRLWGNSQELLAVTDGAGTYRAVNPAWTRVLGWSPQELIGRHFREIVHPDDQEASDIAFALACRGEMSNFENRLRHKEGGHRWISWLSTQQEGLIYAAGRHITKEREATDALHASESRLRTVFESSYQLQGLLALDGTLLDANATSLEVIGASRESVLGRPYWETPWFANTAGIPEFVRDAVSRSAAGEPVRRELEVNVAAGSRLFDFSMRPVHDQAGNVVAIVPEAVDITERRKAEEQLRQAQKIEAMGQLTGGVAHDFNNLLMVISGGLELLDRPIESSKRERIMNGMRQAVQRGSGLSRQLLAFSRRQSLRPEPVDLAHRIGAMRELLERSLRGDILVGTNFAADLWTVEVDPGELELVILNLAVNSRDAMPEGGRIDINAQNATDISHGELPGDFVCLSVADSGSGMAPEVMAHAFEPFFTTKEVGKGSGLGLAQTHGFCRASGGFVRIESTVGSGTTIFLYLPRSFKTAESPREPIDAAVSGPGLGRSGRVLLVEDDDEVAALTLDMLHQLGYESVRVTGAEAALGALANGRAIDVVFSDVMMPGAMNGIALAREVRRRRPELPILLTSGYADSGRREAGVPNVEMLAKPYRLNDLAAALTAARHGRPPRISGP